MEYANGSCTMTTIIKNRQNLFPFQAPMTAHTAKIQYVEKSTQEIQQQPTQTRKFKQKWVFNAYVKHLFRVIIVLISKSKCCSV